jgi:hypothetical protein
MYTRGRSNTVCGPAFTDNHIAFLSNFEKKRNVISTKFVRKSQQIFSKFVGYFFSGTSDCAHGTYIPVQFRSTFEIGVCVMSNEDIVWHNAAIAVMLCRSGKVYGEVTISTSDFKDVNITTKSSDPNLICETDSFCAIVIASGIAGILIGGNFENSSEDSIVNIRPVNNDEIDIDISSPGGKRLAEIDARAVARGITQQPGQYASNIFAAVCSALQNDLKALTAVKRELDAQGRLTLDQVRGIIDSADNGDLDDSGHSRPDILHFIQSDVNDHRSSLPL